MSSIGTGSSAYAAMVQDQQKYVTDQQSVAAGKMDPSQLTTDWNAYLQAASAWQTSSVGGNNPPPTILPIHEDNVSNSLSTNWGSSTPTLSAASSSTPTLSGASSGSAAAGTGVSGSADSGGVVHENDNGPAYTQAALAKAMASTDTSGWMPYDALFSSASQVMLQAGDTPAEIGMINNAIQNEGKAVGLDPRIILAQMMQESQGNLNVVTTNGGVSNPGLLQSHNGSGFDPANPEASINQMIKDGVEGTWGKAGGGPGLADDIVTGGSLDVGLRLYNSGSAHPGDLSNISFNGQNAGTAGYIDEINKKLTTAEWNWTG